MNLREQFKRPDVKDYDYQPYGYINAMQKYCDRLEQRNKEHVEALEEADREIKSLVTEYGLTEKDFDKVSVLKMIKEQLKKSE